MPARRTPAPPPAPATPAEKLGVYRAKRDFGRTPEPSGEETGKGGDGALSFVVQKHDARRLHYDFRLELDGVLLSWAIPKGPSLDPADKRLAVQTEDHPLSYGGFEGIIPEGEYGGGSVIVWDRGRWIPEGDPRDGMRRGRLTFDLEGEKLRGKFHLVRTRGRAGGSKDSWLFFASKEHGEAKGASITERQPESVVSGRTVEEVAASPDRVWHSKPVSGAGGGIKARVRALADQVMARRALERSGAGKTDGKAARESAAAAPPAPSAAKAKAKAKTKTKTGKGDGPVGLAALIASIPKTLSISTKLTNLDKVLYPEQGLTKAAVFAYYAAVAERMVPLVADRPLMLVRCPEGTGRQCFYQKHVGKGTPAAIRRISIVESGESQESMTIDDLDGLIALAQLGALEVHTWGCRRADVERPDLLVMDLDPDESLAWDAVKDAAVELRQRLADHGLESFVKTTGGKGLHVVAPVAPGLGWDDFKAFAQGLAVAMVRDAPARFVANMARAQRRGKIFVDYLRNGRGATAVAPYSTRARKGAPVAAPITWEELDAGVSPSDFDVLTMPARLASLRRDPWEGFLEIDQAIDRSGGRAKAASKPRPPSKPRSPSKPRTASATKKPARRSSKAAARR